jgi:hypothetical protein
MTTDVLLRICDYFEVDANWLLGHDDIKIPARSAPVVWLVDASELTAAVGLERAKRALLALGVKVKETK